MDNAKIQMILDRLEIIDVSNRYATGCDLRDSEIYRSCFTDEIDTDFSSVGIGDKMKLSADAWVDIVINFMQNYEATQHIITNHSITINGDEATSIAYLQAQHLLSGSLHTIGGYYTNKLKRTSKGWRITDLKLTQTWTSLSDSSSKSDI